MSRKDYELIAAAFKDELFDVRRIYRDVADCSIPETALRRMANRLASTLLDDNPRFDTNKFIAACGF